MRERPSQAAWSSLGLGGVCFHCVHDLGSGFEDIEAAIREAARRFGANARTLSSARWRARRGATEGDIAFVIVDGEVAPGFLRAIDDASRSAHVIWVAPRHVAEALSARPTARAQGVLAHEEISAPMLDLALRGLVSARAAERRLLGVIAEQNQALSSVRATFERLGSSFRASDFDSEDVMGLLREVEVSLSSALTSQARGLAREAPAADLVNILGSSLAAWSRSDGGAVSALVSDGPIWLGASARDVETLLNECVRLWRRDRGIGDRLEWIVWDAGDSARAAAVMSRPGPAGVETCVGALATRLARSLGPLVQACGASIEIGPETAVRATLTLVLPKRSLGHARTVRRPASLPRELVAQGRR